MSKVICMYCRQEVVDDKCGCLVRYIQAYELYRDDTFPNIECNDISEDDNPF